MGNQDGAVRVLEVIDSATELGMQEVWRGRALKRKKEREGAGRDPNTVHRPDKVQPAQRGASKLTLPSTWPGRAPVTGRRC